VVHAAFDKLTPFPVVSVATVDGYDTSINNDGNCFSLVNNNIITVNNKCHFQIEQIP